MVCELWKTRLDTYLDGELASEEMLAFDSHVHSCPSCGVDALARVQMKRSTQAVGNYFVIGDASAIDVHNLAELLKRAAA